MEKYTMELAAAEMGRWFIQNCPRQFLQTIQEKDFEVGGRVTVRWEACRGVDLFLEFDLEEEVTVSWPGAGRKVVTALAAVSLYRTVVEFAACLEAKRMEELNRVVRSGQRQFRGH